MGRGIKCSICGLVIPQEIVSSRHPLYGTIDHTIPKSKGGTDENWNRAPAHLLCNGLKGNGGFDRPADIHEVQRRVATELRRFVPCGKKALRKVRRRMREDRSDAAHA